ncbi:MAG: hypothetical protein ACR2L2_01130 [Acidobacteriota bacterium]
MRRKFCLLLVLVLLAATPGSSGAQSGATQQFDLKETRQELEIMRGILETTLDFVTRDNQSEDSEASLLGRRIYRGGFSDMSSYYLQGQGALFTIPSHSLRGSIHGLETNNFMLAPGDSVAYAALTTARAAIARRQPPQPSQAAQVAPGTPPSPPPAVEATTEQLKERLDRAREAANKRREQEAQRQQNFDKQLVGLKAALIEALARHGDSLVTVKANEYVTVIVTGEGRTNHVLSVQKSHITDFKAGRLTLDAFKQKVLDYRN